MWRNGGQRKRLKRKTQDSNAMYQDKGMKESRKVILSRRETEIFKNTTRFQTNISMLEDSDDDLENEDIDSLPEDNLSDEASNECSNVNDDLYNCYVLPTKCSKFLQTEKLSWNVENLSEIKLRYSALSLSQVRALCISLVPNSTVTLLDLCSCQLTLQACQYVCDMVSQNRAIQTIDISENNLRTEGAAILTDCMKTNVVIESLLLNKNNFKDSDACYFLVMLQSNTALKELYLSGNHFSMQAGAFFGEALQTNTMLNVLDLSWNKIRMDGAVLLIHGIQNNTSLRELDLAWNGLGLRGCKVIGKCLQVNKTLQKLDVTSNRISREAFQILIHGLAFNGSILSLRVGKNPITSDGVMDFLQLVLTLPKDKMTQLCLVDFSDISVGTEFNKLYKEIKKTRQLVIHHGTALRQDDIGKVNVSPVIHSEQPVHVLFDCMRRANLRVTDMFHSFDKDKSNSLTREEFKRGLLNMNIPLSSRALDLLLEHTDIDKDGEVSLTDLLSVQKDYMKNMSKRRHRDESEISSAFQRLKIQPAINA